MRQDKIERRAATPWHVPVAIEEIAETGQQFELAASGEVRTAVARMAGLRDLPRLEANLHVTRYGAGGLRVVGRVSATVGQICVVTLEPLVNEVEETIDLVFVPPGNSSTAGGIKAGHEPRSLDRDESEPLIGGTIDLGALATEFLILGLDPYPRKPGAVFQSPQYPKPSDGPFAALGRLKRV